MILCDIQAAQDAIKLIIVQGAPPVQATVAYVLAAAKTANYSDANHAGARTALISAQRTAVNLGWGTALAPIYQAHDNNGLLGLFAAPVSINFAMDIGFAKGPIEIRSPIKASRIAGQLADDGVAKVDRLPTASHACDDVLDMTLASYGLARDIVAVLQNATDKMFPERVLAGVIPDGGCGRPAGI